MSDQDKRNECARYNRYAEEILAAGAAVSLGLDGALSVREELRAPYLCYEGIVRRLLKPGTALLDVCCGNGVHSLTAALGGARVTASDIAESNLAVVRLRAARAGVEIASALADAEQLPFANHSFDVITCAGGLSYVDLPTFLAEVVRVLKPGGAFICVDSFNHNPVYRLNRYFHYLRGNRSYSTLQRMPNRQTLALMRATFPDLEVRHFGTGSFLMPLIRPIAGAERAARFSDWLDERLPFMREWAFKIVVCGHVHSNTLS